VVPLDGEVAQRLRACCKPVLIAANKADTPRAEANAVDFAGLGFDQIFPVSAAHDRGVEALMDAAAALLPASGVERRESVMEAQEAELPAVLHLRPLSPDLLKLEIGRAHV